MSRRRSRMMPTVWLDWSPEIAAAFGLVPAGWSPPLRVKISGGLRHSTMTARFRTPRGFTSTARVRIADVAATLSGAAGGDAR